MDLFGLMKVMCGGSQKQWDDVTPADKRASAFMVNRLMGIQFPTQASNFNTIGTNQVGIVDCWRIFGKQLSGVPKFVYTKTKKTEKDTKWSPNKDALAMYMSMYQLSPTDIASMYNLNQEKLDKNLKEIETILKQKDE